MRSKLSFLLPALAALTLSTPVFAGNPLEDPGAKGVVPIGRGYGTVSTNILGIVKYIGPNACADIAVAAGGDITFQSGACGAEAADTTLECPVSAPLGGVFDLSTPAAACDTWGEVADLINASGSWIFIPIGVKRGDSTDNVAITLSETDNVGTKKGVALLKDDTTSLNTTIMVTDTPTDDATAYVTRTTGNTFRFKSNPWEDSVFRLIDWTDTVTTGGATTLTVDCTLNSFDPETGAWTEASRTIWSSATAASTAEFNKTFPFLECGRGEKMLARVTSTSSHTAATAFASGYRRDAKR